MAYTHSDLTIEQLKKIYAVINPLVIEHIFTCGQSSKKTIMENVECRMTGGKHDFVQVPFADYRECRQCGTKQEKTL